MALMDFFRRLFAGGNRAAEDASGEAVEYNGYTIRPAPQKQAGGWNTAGVISKQFPDGTREHRFVRVDTHGSRDAALAFSITKARQIIDEQGDRLFAGR